MLSLLTNLPVFPYADASIYNYKSAATILGVSGGRHFTCSSVMESGGVYPLPVRGHTLSYDALAETSLNLAATKVDIVADTTAV